MISILDISPEFATLLRQAGWEQNRKVSIEEWVNALSLEGFFVNNIAISILESLGNICVIVPPAGINPYYHELQFDPIKAATGESDRVMEWYDEGGVSLFPIGQEVKTGNVIWAGGDNKFYYGRDYGLYHLGDNFKSAMDRLIVPNLPLDVYIS